MASAALAAALACTVLVAPPARAASDGTMDSAFTTNNGAGANGNVESVAVQADGKVVLGGGFTTWDGATVGRVVRLNTDGTRDTAFTINNGTGANGTVYSVAVQADGKVILGGGFTTWDGATVGGVVRLNTDGTRDTAFTTSNGTGTSGAVYSVAVQADQKIILGGYITTWNGAAVGGVVRLNTDGTHDTAFTTNNGTGVDGNVRSVAVQANQSIILGGYITTWNGTAVGNLVRLDALGYRDVVFSTNVGSGAIYGSFGTKVLSVTVQADQRIIVGGDFRCWNSSCGLYAVHGIVRLLSTGSVDSEFGANIGGTNGGMVYSAAEQADGKVILGGDFTTWNSDPVQNVVRVNSNWTRDTAFTTTTGTGANGGVKSVAVQADGKLILGGDFTTWNGTP